MTRSKFSTKVVLLATGIGLSIAAFAGSQPAAAQSYSGAYPCPAGSVPYYNPYGCGDYGYYGYPYGAYGLYDGRHREFDHGFGHGMGDADHGIGFAHLGGGGFDHGMGAGFGHGGGGGHR
jgi:hypothetical protein